jgi:5'-nucleotidase
LYYVRSISVGEQVGAAVTRRFQRMPDFTPPQKLSDHRVLIVNDDGVEARGIKLLEEIAREFTDDVWVVAPDEEKSGFSHSISMTVPIRVRKIDDHHFAVKGTPTDCALLAIYEFMGARAPTVLLSGINRGANLAEDITYSGTAAAAMEGALLGIRSVALSQVFALGGPVHWATARRFAPPVLARLLSCEWEPGTFVNVNFPDAPPENVGPARVTTQGRRLPGSFRPVRRVDERDFPYYWIKMTYNTGALEVGTDLHTIADNEVSVTPMHLDFTSSVFQQYLNRAFEGL